MSSDSIVIVAAKRTPIGAFQGALTGATATELGAAAIGGALGAVDFDPALVGEVLMGCVLPAGLGQAPARQAALGGGVPLGAACTTVNKMCGSGMKAIMLGYDALRAGSAGVVVAGGLESMSNAPYLLPGARGGYRMGHREIVDHMFLDGLQDFDEGHMMGHYAEQTARKYGFTRDQQDAFAIESGTRAKRSVEDGTFEAEIAPVTIRSRRGDSTVTEDETPGKVDLDRIPDLKPAFARDGSVTAASSSSISDGAAAVIMTTESRARELGLEPLARVVGHSSFAQEPAWFTTAPVHAIKTLHERLGWSPDDVDLYEINEAFAVVTMAAMTDCDIPHDKVNVHGGACAMGHPIGATGARITTTLIHALRSRGQKRGIASLCIGGGEAVAIGIEVD